MTKTFAIALLLGAFVAFAAGNVSAQCTPDASAGGLYSPSQSQGLPEGNVGVNYSAVITVNVPEDTVLFGFPATLDSTVLTEVEGLPPGFQYECVPNSCSFPSGQKSCILLSGFTDDFANAKDWPITTTFVFYGKQGTISLSYPYTEELYTLTLGAMATGVSDFKEEELRLVIGPNPVNKQSSIIYDLPTTAPANLVIYNLVGSAVYKQDVNGKVGQNSLRMNGIPLDGGIYFVELTQGNYNRSARFVIQE